MSRPSSICRRATTVVALALSFGAGAGAGHAVAMVSPGEAEEFPAVIGGNAGGFPLTILAGPDGNIWYAEGAGKIVRMRPDGTISAEYPIPGGPGGSTPPYGRVPYGLAWGHEQDLWFTDANYDEEGHCFMGRMTSSGASTEFPIPIKYLCPHGIAVGADGNMWFTETGVSGQPGTIGRITPAGVISEFLVPASGRLGLAPRASMPVTSVPLDIAVGSDGNMWFTDRGGNYEGQNFVGRITPTGAISEFPIPTPRSDPTGIALGPGGDMWFTEVESAQVGRISPTGVISELKVPATSDTLRNIVLGPDGNMWFTENGVANAIGRITPEGDVTSFSPITVGGGFAESLGIGPDGNIWFTEYEASRVGRFVVPFAPGNVEPPAISGNAVQGEVLSVAAGVWSHAPERFGYQWQLCDAAGGSCTNLGGQLTAAHYVSAADVGHRLRAVVTAENAGGVATALSAASAVVQAPAAPPPIVPAESTPAPVVGSAMTWNFGWTRTYTIVESLVVRGVPAGGVVEVTCRGRGCAFARWRSGAIRHRPACGHGRCRAVPPGSVVHGEASLAGLFRSRRLKVGAHIIVSVEEPGWIGKSFTFTVRANKPPRVQIACLGAGASKPTGGC